LYELTKLYTTEDIVSVGGKIVPIWLSEKPEWYTNQLGSYLSLLDLSQTVKQIVFPDCPYGCNMSFKKSIFSVVGYFDVSFGRCLSKNNLLSGEEIDLCKQIDEKGYKTMYNPKAIVHHQIDASRLTKAWFRKRFYWAGISRTIFHKKNYATSYVFKITMKTLFFTIPYDLVRYLAEGIKKNDKSFMRELNLLFHLGYVKESLGLNFGDRK
jgi:cellulose synthase/poly-beta-1,6-N-acetylglucosamine synthase-like glycosyltransferase